MSIKIMVLGLWVVLGGSSIRFEDVTGDGLPDRLMLDSTGTLTVAVNTGARGFDPVGQPHVVGVATSVHITDLNGDQVEDLFVVANGPNVALVGDGTGRFLDRTELLGLVDFGSGLVAEFSDIDGDGLGDILVHNEDGDVLFWNNGGVFEREAGQPPLNAPAPLGVPPVGPLLQPPMVTLAVPSQGEVSLGTRVVGFGPSTSLPATLPLSFLDARFVNDDMHEVDGTDVVDYSLTGSDVSTSVGDVIHLAGKVGIGTSTPLTTLDVEGNLRVTGTVSLSETTRYLSLPGVAFSGAASTTWSYSQAGNIGGFNNGDVYAPVRLPHGAVIREFRVLADGGTAQLVKRAFGVTGPSRIVAELVADGAVQSVISLSEVVDNENAVYWFRMGCCGGNLYNMGVTYTITEPLP